MPSQNILSIYWGICSGASIIRDGYVVAAVHEERFSRKKNDDSFPCMAIDWCLKETELKACDLNGVAVASHHQDYYHQLTRPGGWSVKNYLEEQHLYWKPLLLEGGAPSYIDVMGHLADHDQYPDWYWKDKSRSDTTFPQDRKFIVAKHLGVAEGVVSTIEHHRAHAYYAYHASPFYRQQTLAFTIDANGDGLNATIGVFDEGGNYKRLFETNQCFIARYYRYMTLLLGMKPNEHEYKLMGLAPYGREKYGHKALELFRDTLYVDGLEFKWKIKPSDSYFWFRERLEGHRFDNIAWALQTWVEELISQWVSNAVSVFGIDTVIISGGVSMNIKAMGVLASLPCIKDFFVPGSAADESLAIASGLCLYDDLKKIQIQNNLLRPTISNLYLGPNYDEKEELAALSLIDPDSYDVFDNFNLEDVAERLLAGDVIGRCCGRMEFGQRSLGNRSLLADPAIPYIKEKINSMIKSRDFWMPFAPILLDSFKNEYLARPIVDSPYMTIGFDTTSKGYDAMRAACHPADRTARAQILTNSMNPSMYKLLQCFALKSGRGALLNTSFNIHGEPIVCSPAEAIDVLKRTSLDGLLMDRYFILRKSL
jgi:carbamoyltransferase